MRRYLVTAILASLVLGLAALFVLSGCEEKDVPVLVDEDEIVKYLGSVGIAKELFRTTGLFNSTPYALPFDTVTVTDVVVSRTRSMQLYLVPLKVLDTDTLSVTYGDTIQNDLDSIYVDHGYLGKLRECLVRVDDRFRIQTTYAYTEDTVVDTGEVTLTRYGFFLKFGADTQDFLGWVLWGFNGTGTTARLGIRLEESDGSEFRGDLGLYNEEPVSKEKWIPAVTYIRLSAIDTVSPGSRLLVTTQRASAGTVTHQLISDYGADGAFTRLMHRYNETEYIDSLSYQTPNSNPRTYNQLLIQSIAATSYPNRTAVVVPYRK